jgi:GDP-L-fucose synthase
MDKSSRIYVAGHHGLVGSAICRRLMRDGYSNLIVRDRSQLDLTHQPAVEAFFASEKPEYVFLAAAKVGGILANSTYPVDFLRDNLSIELNVTDAAYRHGVKKLESLGSSCIYPKLAPQPIKEEYLLTSPLEASHVLPALMRKAHEARVNGSPEMVVWGTGAPRREFLHVDDLADAALFLMLHYDEAEIINVGVGTDLTIRELAELVCQAVGYDGRLVFDASKPDGTPQKLLDVSRLRALGWQARINLEAGIRETYQWYLAQQRQPVAT